MNKVKTVTIIGIILDIFSILMSLGLSLIMIEIGYAMLIEGDLGRWILWAIIDAPRDGWDSIGMLFIYLLFIPLAVIILVYSFYSVYETIASILKFIKDIRVFKSLEEKDINIIIKYSKSKLLPIMISLNPLLIVTDILRLIFIRKATGIRVI